MSYRALKFYLSDVQRNINLMHGVARHNAITFFSNVHFLQSHCEALKIILFIYAFPFIIFIVIEIERVFENLMRDQNDLE